MTFLAVFITVHFVVIDVAVIAGVLNVYKKKRALANMLGRRKEK